MHVTSHFINIHFVNSHLVNLDEVGIDKVRRCQMIMLPTSTSMYTYPGLHPSVCECKTCKTIWRNGTLSFSGYWQHKWGCLRFNMLTTSATDIAFRLKYPFTWQTPWYVKGLPPIISQGLWLAYAKWHGKVVCIHFYTAAELVAVTICLWWCWLSSSQVPGAQKKNCQKEI